MGKVFLTAGYGVTLLALGNGAPDIFSSYAAIDQNDDRDASLAFGALFGKRQQCSDDVSVCKIIICAQSFRRWAVCDHNCHCTGGSVETS